MPSRLEIGWQAKFDKLLSSHATREELLEAFGAPGAEFHGPFEGESVWMFARRSAHDVFFDAAGRVRAVVQCGT